MCQTAAQMAHQAEGDLDEVVAGPGLVEQRAEQHEEEHERGRDPQRDAEYALGGDPLVVHHFGQRIALMRDDPRHQRTQEGIGQEHRRHDHQRRAQSTARRLQQDHQAEGGNDEVLQDRRADPLGDAVIEDEQVQRCAGPQNCQGPFPDRDPRFGRAQQDRPDHRQANDRDPPDRRVFFRTEDEQEGQQRRHHDPQPDLERRPGGGIGGKGQEQRESQVEGPRLGIVEDAKAQHEGQGAGNPELEQRPDDRDHRDQPGNRDRRRATADIGGSDKFVDFRLAETTPTRCLLLDCGCFLLAAVIRHMRAPADWAAASAGQCVPSGKSPGFLTGQAPSANPEMGS